MSLRRDCAVLPLRTTNENTAFARKRLLGLGPSMSVHGAFPKDILFWSIFCACDSLTTDIFEEHPTPCVRG